MTYRSRLIGMLALASSLVMATPSSAAVRAPSTAPTVVSPAAGSTVTPSPTFSWTSVANANNYRLQVANGTDTTFSSPLISLLVGNVTSYVPGTAMASGSYRTRVRARNSGGLGPWSPVVTFSVATATPPPTDPVPPPSDPAPSGAIWRPTADRPLTLHWVLEDALDVNDPVQMGLRDLNGGVLPEPDVFDIDGEFNTAATVASLHAKGKKVICYFDAGVYETYRTDAWKFQAIQPRIWGNADAGWNGSYWLDIRRIAELEPIMKARMQMCKDKGFDAIEPDEIDGYSNNSGFALTYEDQLAYNRRLAVWAHELGLSIGQKGDIAQSRDLVTSFDWTLNEECFEYDECVVAWDEGLRRDVPGLGVYVQANKAVWIAEYASYTTAQWTTVCQTSTSNRFNTARYRLGLPNAGGRKPCPTTSATSW